MAPSFGHLKAKSATFRWLVFSGHLQRQEPSADCLFLCLRCSGPRESPFLSVDLGDSWQITPPAAPSLSPVTEGRYVTLGTAA